MGYCVSYDEMRAVNTNIAKEDLAKVEAFGTVTPNNIEPTLQQLKLTHPLLAWPIDQRRLKVKRTSD